MKQNRYQHIGLTSDEVALLPNKEEYALTAGGYRLQPQLVEAEMPDLKNNSSRRRRKGKLNFLSKKNNLIQPLSLISESFTLASNSAWLAWAKTIDTNRQLTSFTASWQVPAHPTVDNGQTMFIFPCVQNNRYILQPILRWNNSQWNILSMYASNQAVPPKVSQSFGVGPGTMLTAYIQVSDRRGDIASYSCGFVGYDATHLSIGPTQSMNELCITLEAHNIRSRSELSASELCMVGNISVSAGSVAPVHWQTSPMSSFGAHTSIIQEGIRSQIALYF